MKNKLNIVFLSGRKRNEFPSKRFFHNRQSLEAIFFLNHSLEIKSLYKNESGSGESRILFWSEINAMGISIGDSKIIILQLKTNLSISPFMRHDLLDRPRFEGEIKSGRMGMLATGDASRKPNASS